MRVYGDPAGEVEALLDRKQQERGCDDDTALSRACMALLLDIGRLASRNGPKGSLETLKTLTDLVSSASCTLRAPERYAFYAVYPERYAAVAKRAKVRFQAVGVRSIGTSLAAVPAAAKWGHPLRRASVRRKSEWVSPFL